MEYKIHKVEAEEKVKDIAKKYNITVEEIKRANPNVEFFEAIFGDEYVACLQEVLIPVENDTIQIIDEQYYRDFLKFKYRVEQVNLTKIEEEIKSYSLLKKQYDVNFDLNKREAFVKLTDLYYDFSPPVIGEVYEFISYTEYIRNDVHFRFDKNGRINKILNINNLFGKWNNFKNNKIDSLDFIKTLKKENSVQYESLIKEGDKQFSNNNVDDYHKDLLYCVLFDKHLTASFLNDIKEEKSSYKSQLLPEIEIPMEVIYQVLKEDQGTITVKKVADSIINNELLTEIEKKYNEIHKPLIKYKFSNYKLVFRILYNVDKKTRVINNAQVTIIESIEHNIQSVCKFKLVKLENDDEL